MCMCTDVHRCTYLKMAPLITPEGRFRSAVWGVMESWILVVNFCVASVDEEALCSPAQADNSPEKTSPPSTGDLNGLALGACWSQDAPPWAKKHHDMRCLTVYQTWIHQREWPATGNAPVRQNRSLRRLRSKANLGSKRQWVWDVFRLA